MHAKIARQATDDPTPGRTEILTVDARILESRTEGRETVISVLFDALLREDGPEAPSEQVILQKDRDPPLPVEPASPRQQPLPDVTAPLRTIPPKQHLKSVSL
ncbi:MAG: hypothetical protein RBR38_04995 [Desulfomicrobium apsheronum]|nr:hypothetical protein [Desulfomicrobium apsheronum]